MHVCVGGWVLLYVEPGLVFVLTSSSIKNSPSQNMTIYAVKKQSHTQNFHRSGDPWVQAWER